MYCALEAGALDVVDLGYPTPPGRLWPRISRRLTRAHPLDSRLPSFGEDCRRFASRVSRQVRKLRPDVLFAAASSEELASLDVDVPAVYCSDVTFRLLRATYELPLDEKTCELRERAEQAAIAAAEQLVYSSEWAAESAIRDYGADPDRIHIIDFGANLERIPPVESTLKKCADSACRLLFVGKDFRRKGGDEAVAALEALVEMGVDASMVLVGCEPPHEIASERIKVIPFLDKQDPQQLAELERIYLDSHFLVFPSRADCSPIVICEANAFGLPAITSSVGGVPTLVKDGVNGKLLPPNATGADYARVIHELFSDRERYRACVRGSRNEYETRLNWRSWSSAVEDVLVEAAQR
jgi:glycosyltransferase involved in cell wall biosynthesis